MKPLDVARGLYVRSPGFVRTAIRPLVAAVPTNMKFGSTYKEWRSRISRAESDLGYARDQHLSSLRALFAKARNSPYYRELIESAFGRDFDAASLMPQDLRHLPALGKAQLQEAGEAVLAVPRWQVDKVGTSGSNAEPPFQFFLDKDRSPREMAFVYDAWARSGFGERDARATLRGMRLEQADRYDWDPALRELKLSVFPMTVEDVEVYLDQMDQREIRFLYGYPSAIELLCRRMHQLQRVPRAGISGILPISEPIFDHQREFIRRVLGDVKFGTFYGLSEKAAFAVETQSEDGIYEFNPLYGVAELVDAKGDPIVEVGREGRVIGTGFLSTGMPFIRYDTGDSARLHTPATAENGYRLRVTGLIPRRKPDFLVSYDGQRVVTTSITSTDAEWFNGIAELQFYQDTAGEVVIRYILDAQGSHADAERLRSLVAAQMEGRLTFSLEETSRIASGRGGKRAFIDQRLDISQYA